MEKEKDWQKVLFTSPFSHLSKFPSLISKDKSFIFNPKFNFPVNPASSYL